MAFYNKNKNEMLVLTAAVYSFMAYLTAFTLEILFIIDFAKQNDALLPTLTPTSSSSARSYDESNSAYDQARLALESMQAHITISCLAVSILYFIIFVASLILISALILRSIFFILIWMCIMTTLYLPEFGLVVYVSIYGWGLGTRNGQTEFIFYLFRSILNVIFISRAHKLFKEWNYEKNFFRLKSGSRFTGYDSPYFISDSLTTTINPVFSTSTLNLDRYDRIRELNNNSPPSASANNNTGTTDGRNYPDYNLGHFTSPEFLSRARGKSSMMYEAERRYRNSYEGPALVESTATSRPGFYLPGERQQKQNPIDYHQKRRLAGPGIQMRPGSVLSFNDTDDFPDYEMDLEYRTLTNQRNQHNNLNSSSNHDASGRQQVARLGVDNTANNNLIAGRGLDQSISNLSYSTQSLDRRHLKDMDFVLPEQVILRPLGHQPFEYLHRPGSINHLNSMNSLNTQPAAYLSSSSKLAKQSD